MAAFRDGVGYDDSKAAARIRAAVASVITITGVPATDRAALVAWAQGATAAQIAALALKLALAPVAFGTNPGQDPAP